MKQEKHEKRIITISRDEAIHLESCLSGWGNKKQFAYVIFRSPSYVSMMLRPVKAYNKDTKGWVEEYRLPENEYKALLKFIESL